MKYGGVGRGRARRVVEMMEGMRHMVEAVLGAASVAEEPFDRYCIHCLLPSLLNWLFLDNLVLWV